MAMRFSAALPSEEVGLTFDFTNALSTGETLLAISSVQIEAERLPDPNASSIQQSAVILGDTAFVVVSGMQNNTDYHITVTCTTSTPEKTVALAGLLPVRR